MYCRICGVLNKDGANFCKRCGASLKGEPLKIQDAGSPIMTQDAGSVPPARNIGNDYLVPNIVAAFLCLPFGVIGICCSAFARELRRRGDWEVAKKRAKDAKMMFWLSMALGVPPLVLFVVNGGLEVIYAVFWVLVKSFVFLDPPI